jgi:hypothetical protein
MNRVNKLKAQYYYHMKWTALFKCEANPIAERGGN